MTELFNQRYYKVNKFLLSIIGQWPYQPRFRKRALLVLFVILFVSQLIPQVLAVIENTDDPDVILESISPFVIDFACATKLANVVINSNKMLELADRIKSDWATLIEKPEMSILENYAEMGRKFTLVYATTIYVVGALFMVLPMFPQLLAALHFIDQAPPLIYPFPVDYYGIDFDKYYYYMLTHSIIVVGLIVTVIVAADTMFIVQIQHACGMFTVVGSVTEDSSYPKWRFLVLNRSLFLNFQSRCQMQRVADLLPEDRDLDLKPAEDPCFHLLAGCIDKHRQVIGFADLLENSYSWSFFSFLGLNMIMMSITGFQVVIKMDDKPEEAFRYGVFTIAQLVHLFFQSFFSQRLMDYSEHVRELMFQAKWYRTSLSSQKLLNLITLRTYRPCRMTAGKFMVMSLPNFASVVKTSMSYFTLLRSMQ